MQNFDHEELRQTSQQILKQYSTFEIETFLGGMVMNHVFGKVMDGAVEALAERDLQSPEIEIEEGTCFRAGTTVLCAAGSRSIETITLGQRVITGKHDDTGCEIDPQAYRLVRLHYVKEGREFHLAYLRPAGQLKDLGTGDFVQLKALELEIEGRARVQAIEACPPIEEGSGRIVTGTVRSVRGDVRQLKLEGLNLPLEITGNHPIFSEERHDFVVARHLRMGERLRTREGLVLVESNLPLEGEYELFNLEVEGAHQYFVTDKQVLVHNQNGGVMGETGAGEVPQGLSPEQFRQAAATLRAGLASIGGDIIVQGSRVTGTAGPASDIDFAVRLSDQEFANFVQSRFGKPSPGSAAERTMQMAIRNGRVHAGEAGLRGLRAKLQTELGVDVDVAVILRGGSFDQGPSIPVP